VNDVALLLWPVRPCSEVYQGQNLVIRCLLTANKWPWHQICYVLLAALKTSQYFIYICPTLSNIRPQIFDKPIMSMCEYEKESTLQYNTIQYQFLIYDAFHLKTDIVLDQPSRISTKLFLNFIRLFSTRFSLKKA
jgi:hypothetical protein